MYSQHRTPTHKGATSSSHNSWRWFLVVAPGAALILLLGGKPVWLAGFAGLLLAYTSDLLGSSAGALTAMWITLFGMLVASLVAAAPLVLYSLWNIFLLLTMGVFLLLVGILLSLQSEWLRARLVFYQGDALTERVLHAGFPIPASSLCAWATASVLGNTAAPWGLLASLSACYYLIGLPTSSSFSGKPSSSLSSSGTGDDQRAAPVDYYSSRPTSRWVQGRFESAVLVALLVAGPALLNLALRHRQFSTELLLDTLPLASLPLVFLRLLIARGSLWWTGASERGAGRLAGALGVVGGVGLVVWGALRVVLGSWRAAGVLAIGAPWDAPLVLGAALAFAILPLFHLASVGPASEVESGLGFGGGKQQTRSARATAPLLAGAAGLAAFAAGVPWYLLPVGVVCGYFLGLLYTSSSPSPSAFGAFAVSAVTLGAWYAYHAFGHLFVYFPGVDASLQWVSGLGVLLLAVSLAVVGLTWTTKWRAAVSVALLLQAALLAHIEQALYLLPASNAYPGYLVGLTSMVGIVAAFRLLDSKQISGGLAWLLVCVYAAKLGLLASPVDGPITNLLLLALVASAPFVLHSNFRPPTFLHTLGYGAAWAAALWWTHGAFLQRFLQLASPAAIPSALARLAIAVVVWGVWWITVSGKYGGWNGARARVGACVVAVGLALCVIALSPASTTAPVQYVHSFLHPPVAAPAPAPPTPWGHWAVVAMVVLGVGGATGVLPAGERGWARGLVCVSAAGCATVYLCGAYLPARLLLAALLFAALAAQSLFAGFVNWPSARVAQALPYLYAAALALYAALLLAIPAAFASVPGLLGKESTRSWRVVVLGLAGAVNIVIALVLRFRLAGHPSGSASRASRRAASAPAARKATPVGWEWAPVAANLSVGLSFVAGVWLSLGYLNGSPLSVVALSSALLLLERDHLLLRRLSDTSRYLPPVAAASAALLASALWDIAQGLGGGGYTWVGWVKDAVFVGSSAPLLWQFLAFLRDHKGRVPFGPSVWAVAPLVLAALVLATSWAVRLLAVAALLAAIALGVLHLLSRRAALRRI